MVTITPVVEWSFARPASCRRMRGAGGLLATEDVRADRDALLLLVPEMRRTLTERERDANSDAWACVRRLGGGYVVCVTDKNNDKAGANAKSRKGDTEDNGKIVVAPGCCCDLGVIGEWRDAVRTLADGAQVSVWNGHDGPTGDAVTWERAGEQVSLFSGDGPPDPNAATGATLGASEWLALLNAAETEAHAFADALHKVTFSLSEAVAPIRVKK